MPFLEKGDVKIHYNVWDAGIGPWVTLVNGYTRTLTDFKAMAKFLAERNFRVITFDNRGAGKAECPPVFTLDDIGDDILELWEHFQVGQSHLLGISYGGAIAATLAARVSDRVQKLVLVSTPVAAEYLTVEADAPSRDPRRFVQENTKYFSKKFLDTNKLLIDGFLRQTLKVFQDPDTSLGARAQRESMTDLDLNPLLSNIRARTLILHGEEDRVVGLESAKFLASKIPNAELTVIPEVGHLLLAECPRLFYEKVADFLIS